MKKKNRTKQIELPMKFNPGLSKYEPELPSSKKSSKLKTKKNNWAYWYIIILIILMALTLFSLAINYFKG